MIKLDMTRSKAGRPAMAVKSDFEQAVARVVAAGNCSGCGLCAALSDNVEMRLDAEGFSRPAWVGGGRPDSADVRRRFRRSCPGVTIRPPQTPVVNRHPTLGLYVSAWSGWASDDQVRHIGSSAGVLTALSSWLVESGRATEVVGAAASRTQPSRTVPVKIRSRADALAASGSRYAPVGVAAAYDVDSGRTDVAFVGKPCEAYAVRSATEHRPAADSPFILSFFCAGVPSQLATDALVDKLAGGAEVDSVRYRGNGWPGMFSVRDRQGTVAEVDYEESWGEHLGPHIQPRCKICPDGTGEHADIAVGDFWNADSRGYPQFSESTGNSAVIARTRRGHEALMAAQMAGIVELHPVKLDDVAAIQPLQTRRRRVVLPRLLGRVLAGGRVPRVRGYRLLRTEIATAPSLRQFLGEFIGEAKGARWRAVRGRRRAAQDDVA
ncbi:hypothetical protein GCM10011575_17410 [Microlunatus endophyticus]|uniref:Coenzyme F420 hydrogenase subunit beta n=1 Tax=Microlunatus endophyticus TaxID=1716077 RepID=A0A917S6G0_9ACTN|nr:Coenzyme F420 hydrogenase/dehydrogenase, beta subunit C-terminal domain [Microlunatus endophyticus]GGL59386.1 hypothetical protein GCM10011575_17410 [Microlunatus endophyticus]